MEAYSGEKHGPQQNSVQANQSFNQKPKGQRTLPRTLQLVRQNLQARRHRAQQSIQKRKLRRKLQTLVLHKLRQKTQHLD
jgi:hypothetical protein